MNGEVHRYFCDHVSLDINNQLYGTDHWTKICCVAVM